MIYGTHQSRYDAGKAPAHGTFVDLQDTVTDAVRDLLPHVLKFDAVVVTGVSGLAVGAPVALALEVELVVLRKEGENCHGGKTLLGNCAEKRVLFLDDFVGGGATRRKCKVAVENARGMVVGQFLYADDRGFEELPPHA